MLKLLETPLPAAEEIEALEKLYRTTKDGRLRTYAWVDLLAGEQRMTAPVIAKIVREVTQMVRTQLAQELESRRYRGTQSPAKGLQLLLQPSGSGGLLSHPWLLIDLVQAERGSAGRFGGYSARSPHPSFV